jgi:hypothetical protein
MTYSYSAYGLTICSDIELPGLVALDPHSVEAVDLTIVHGAVSTTGLNDAKLVKPLSQFDGQTLWFDVPMIGRFLVEQGQQVTFESYPGVSLDSIRVYLLGSCLAAIFYQKQRVVLRGAAVSADDKSCVLLVGSGPVGKSSLAAILRKHGYSILSDELCVLAPDGEIGKIVPGLAQLKLWRQTLKYLEVDVDAMARVRPEIEKYFLPVADGFCDNPRAVSTVYILNEHNLDEFVFEEINGFAKFQALTQFTYMAQYIDQLIPAKVHMKQIAALANKVRVVRVSRPNRYFELDELIQRIERDREQGVQSA